MNETEQMLARLAAAETAETLAQAVGHSAGVLGDAVAYMKENPDAVAAVAAPLVGAGVGALVGGKGRRLGSATIGALTGGALGATNMATGLNILKKITDALASRAGKSRWEGLAGESERLRGSIEDTVGGLGADMGEGLAGVSADAAAATRASDKAADAKVVRDNRASDRPITDAGNDPANDYDNRP